MTAEAFPASVSTELAIRVTYPSARGVLARILKSLRTSGGDLRAHLVYRFYEQSTAFFLCENPEKGTLALEGQAVTVETETVVTVRTANRPGILSYLVQTLEAENVDISYSYATSGEGGLLLVFRTSDNPKAEDVVRNYLTRAPPSLPAKSGSSE